MSDFNNPPTKQKAAREHICKYCLGPVFKGEVHWHQKGNYEGSWYSNRYHNECWNVLETSEEYEFLPGDGEIPKRVSLLMKECAKLQDKNNAIHK